MRESGRAPLAWVSTINLWIPLYELKLKQELTQNLTLQLTFLQEKYKVINVKACMAESLPGSMKFSQSIYFIRDVCPQCFLLLIKNYELRTCTIDFVRKLKKHKSTIFQSTSTFCKVDLHSITYVCKHIASIPWKIVPFPHFTYWKQNVRQSIHIEWEKKSTNL